MSSSLGIAIRPLAFLLALAVFEFIPPAVAQPGTLDKSFGEAGIFLFEQNGVSVSTTARQPDDRLLFVGEQSGNALVLRALPSGVLDTSFGEEGAARIDFGDVRDFAAATASAPDGDILIAGASAPPLGSPRAAALARIGPDGTINSDFGSDGVITLGGFVNSFFSVVRVLPDGYIIAAGAAFSFDSVSGIVVARYSATGVPDMTFGDGGIAFSPLPRQFNNAGGFISADGSVLVSGSVSQGGPFEVDASIARTLPSGQLDPTFGTDGLSTFSTGQPFSFVSDVALDASDRIVGGGSAIDDQGGVREAFAVRLLPDGTLDSSFGIGGVATTRGGTALADGSGVAVQADGKVLVSGASGSASQRNLTVFRFTESGALDDSFGQGGVAKASLSFSATGNGVLLQPDGRIVSSGSLFDASSGQRQGAVAVRFLNDGSSVGTAAPPTALGLQLRLDGPNPFRSVAALQLITDRRTSVRVVVFDVLGREAVVLHEGPVPTGTTRLWIDGTELAPGPYFVRASGMGAAPVGVSLIRL